MIKAWVTVKGQESAAIQKGGQLLVGFHKGDSQEAIRNMAGKIAHLRIFGEGSKSFHLSLLDCQLPCLVVPNFTLSASTQKGRRPELISAANFEEAKGNFAFFLERLEAEGLQVEQGIFGEEMEVGIVNDGPVTFILEG